MELLQSLTQSALQPFLTNPAQLSTQPIAFQLAVASYSQTPRHLLEVLVNSPHTQVAEAAQLHVNWAGEMSEDGHNVVEERLKSRYLGQNDRLAVELLKIAPVPPFFLSEWVPSQHLIQALSNPYLPPRYRLKLLERLAKEPSLEPRLQVAETPETPLAVLESLVGDLELAIRVAVSHNPSCPPELVRLVQGQHEIASDWDTDAQQLATLAQSRWDWIRLAIAQNPSTSEETLLELAEDKVFKIQLAIVKNPVTPASVLSVLAEYSEKEIQAAVAVHPNATEEILHRLYPTQQGVIRNRQNLPASILERFFNQRDENTPLWKNNNLIYFLLQQPNTPTWMLAELADVDLEKIKADILANSNHSPIIKSIEEWIQDCTNFLADVAKHPQVSVEILESLSQYPNHNVQLAVAQNQKTPQVLRNFLLRQLVLASQDYIKVKIGSDPQTPVEILKQLSRVSSSLNTMTEMLRQIAPGATPNLLNRIKALIDRHQSPELILFWLQQGKEFQASILNGWDELIASLDDQEKQTLKYIASQESSVEWKGKFTAQRTPRSISSSSRYENLEPSYQLLHRLLYLLNMSYNSDISNQEIIAAILENSSTSVTLREQLWQQCKQETDDMGRYSKDIIFRMALAFNPSVSEEERREYFQQLLEINNDVHNNVFDKLAKNPKTLPEILLKLFETKRVSYDEIARNPNTSANLLAELAQNSNSTIRKGVASNPNIPLDILMKLAKDDNREVRNKTLNNLNMPILERYRLLIAQEEREELEKANQILEERVEVIYELYLQIHEK